MTLAARIPYGRMDRLLHRLAFAGIDVQRSLDRVERRLFRHRLAAVQSERPVLVTSLARAGTTLLLDLLSRQEEFAAATYRHMPFVLCPLLWQAVSGGRRRDGRAAERAHGDGVAIDFDSAEAFEESLWVACWPSHYAGDCIEPWTDADPTPAFAEALRSHAAKVVASRGQPARRYLSKNNASIARLGLLPQVFPDCTIVVPIRHPFAQATSLWRQHKRFRALHAEEPFARDYMVWLGHFEFGAALKPIDFDGWTDAWRDRPGGLTEAADDVAFWLAYWTAAVQAILSAPTDRLLLIDFDGMCSGSRLGLAALAEALDLSDPDALLADGGRIRPQSAPAELPVAPTQVWRSLDLYDAALSRCLPHR